MFAWLSISFGQQHDGVCFLGTSGPDYTSYIQIDKDNQSRVECCRRKREIEERNRKRKKGRNKKKKTKEKMNGRKRKRKKKHKNKKERKEEKRNKE